MADILPMKDADGKVSLSKKMESTLLFYETLFLYDQGHAPKKEEEL
jgi:hypothetical protein